MESSTRLSKVVTLLVTSLGSFMVLLDGSIVLVALPTIQADLQAQLADLQWTVDAYTLPFAALMLAAGTLGDRLGRKRVFLVGLFLFLIGSALCGFAPTLAWLIFGRIVQGIGAAAISTGSLSLLVSTFTDPRERAQAIGIWTAVSGVSLATGPLVGGALIEAFDWPSIFFMNLPIGALALILGLPKLIESRNPDARRVDVSGQILVTGGLICLVYALIQGERQGWASAPILTLLVAAGVLLVAFVVVEARVREPLLPLELFGNASFSVTCLIASLLGFITVGAMFFMAQYFQAVQGGSALDAGLRLLPLTLGIFVMSPPAGRITGRVGPRPPIVVGAVLVAIGFALLSTIEPGSSYGSVWWRLGLVGIGIGCMFAPLTVAVMAATPQARAGLGSSMINTFRIVGFTAGAAILGTVVLARFTDAIPSRLSERGVPTPVGDAVASQIADSGAYASSLPLGDRVPLSPADASAAINAAFVDSVRTVFVICAVCMLVAGVLAALFLGRARPGAPGGTSGPGAGARSSGPEEASERADARA
ncbi:DHA2 family efflux MFS transporter permease subunit [Micromonospora sp. WMMA1998]|uniref:DHA2 family efflux MFS transporter permease subunit n=1 Tax=Micromonospora sp. WMMA1998 TaxID=3015167 RepID=UPI00248D0F35|nr:DHA2 family efflux MFS transporter permease subunit [Micromonospora sp. WMMA1998]WBC14953.1 DHA2 family efflux MFS transporter permease subunit [Micromonospora sp. WMMA1998]